MFKFIITILLILVAGCSERTQTVDSELMVEGGRVVDTLHTVPHKVSDSGFDSNGDYYSYSSTIPETWGVVFRCEHGNKFAIQGSEERYRLLWERLDSGMPVKIHYKEQSKIIERKQEDGTWKVASKEVFDYDFIDAFPDLKAESE